jgi:hypothetical protein
MGDRQGVAKANVHFANLRNSLRPASARSALAVVLIHDLFVAQGSPLRWPTRTRGIALDFALL